jgi:hypothetical protein
MTGMTETTTTATPDSDDGKGATVPTKTKRKPPQHPWLLREALSRPHEDTAPVAPEKVAPLSAPSRAIRERRDLRRRKARGPATDTVNSPHAASQAGELKGRDATPDQNACPTVYDGTTLVGFIRAYADGRCGAFDTDGHCLGIFRKQREAVRAIPARGEA